MGERAIRQKKLDDYIESSRQFFIQKPTEKVTRPGLKQPYIKMVPKEGSDAPFAKCLASLSEENQRLFLDVSRFQTDPLSSGGIGKKRVGVVIQGALDTSSRHMREDFNPDILCAFGALRKTIRAWMVACGFDDKGFVFDVHSVSILEFSALMRMLGMTALIGIDMHENFVDIPAQEPLGVTSLAGLSKWPTNPNLTSF